MPTPADTALNDQLAAATTDAHRYLADTARRFGARINTDHRPHPWLTAQIRSLLHNLNTGQTYGCPHVTGNPQIIHAAVWRPGLVTCSPCSLLLLAAGPGEDTTCDRCRTTGHPMHSGVAATGPVLLGYGLCTPCHNEIHNTRKETR
jgi:hypothetical protein